MQAARNAVMRTYFTRSWILAMPARVQTSSLSPPGAPETAKTPTTSLPAVIGAAPWRAVSIMGLAAISALKAGSAAALAATSPLVILYFSTAWILLMAIRWVTAAAPSLEITTIGTPVESAIIAVVL